MTKIGFNFPKEPRNTILLEAEEWYQNILVEKLGRPYEKIQRSNFGEYNMAVHYLTSVLEEAKAVDKVAVYNIDHMAQIRFSGKDADTFLNRVLPTNIEAMKIGQCKYTLLLTEKGTVIDDMIVMREAEDSFILVINAGHDITDTGFSHGEEKKFLADADVILQYKKDAEEVSVKDISDELVKIDVQGPLSFKLIKNIYGEQVLKNRRKPTKNMGFFSFNEFEKDGEKYIISRTGYTNRWGFELYVPANKAVEDFKKIALEALNLGGLVVGLGGRDENRISAGNVGLPLNGSEYDLNHTPINAPLFPAAIDMTKDQFVGKDVLAKEMEKNPTKKMVLIISEGIVVDRAVYADGKRLGTVTSSINSPNVSQAKREFIGSKRKNVQGESGTCAIGLAWLNDNPFEVDENGKDILTIDGKPVWIKVEFYKEKDGNPKGRPVIGFIAADGVSPATAPKALKNISNL